MNDVRSTRIHPILSDRISDALAKGDDLLRGQRPLVSLARTDPQSLITPSQQSGDVGERLWQNACRRQSEMIDRGGDVTHKPIRGGAPPHLGSVAWSQMQRL